MATSSGVSVGDHICGFYWGASSRDQILLPFLRAGLRAQERCLCVVHSTEPRDMLNALGDGELVQQWVDSGHLDVRPSSAVYRRDGHFVGSGTRALLDAFISDARASGHTARLAGEGSWALEQPGEFEELMDYESDINDMAPEGAPMMLCLYDLDQFDSERLIEILKTHPKVMLGDIVVDNPNYLTPAQFRAQQNPRN